MIVVAIGEASLAWSFEIAAKGGSSGRASGAGKSPRNPSSVLLVTAGGSFVAWHKFGTIDAQRRPYCTITPNIEPVINY